MSNAAPAATWDSFPTAAPEQKPAAAAFDQFPVAAKPAAGGFDKFAQAAPAPAAPPADEHPFAAVQRLQPKIDDGTASADERNQYLDARTADLHQTTLPERIARTITTAPYGQMAQGLASKAVQAGKDINSTIGTFEKGAVGGVQAHLAAAKAAASIPVGIVAEGGEVGKSLLSSAANAVISTAGAALNPFHPSSDWAARTQAHAELAAADAARNIQPESVKALAPDQAAEHVGELATDVGATLAGPKEPGSLPALAPKNVETIGSTALKAASDQAKLDKIVAAAQKAADASPGPLKAAAQYGVAALRAVPVVGKAVDTIANAGKAVGSGIKAVGAGVTSDLAKRAAVGGAVGSVAGAAGATPGDAPEAFAAGAEGGALVGAARDPNVLAAVNGTKPVELPPLAARPEEPPQLTKQYTPRGPLTVAGKGEPLGPQPEGAGSVDTALASTAAAPAKPPLTLAAQQPPTEPVSRFAGGKEAVSEISQTAQKGNENLRAQIVAGTDKVTPAISESQKAVADKPLATVGPAPAPAGPNAEAMQVSQELGKEISKYEDVDRIVNTLIGGNRTGQGIPTQSIRVHELPHGTEFEIAGQKASIVRPEGVSGQTIVRFQNPDIPDVQVYNPVKDAEGNLQYQIHTDTGPRDVARLSDEDPNPIMIGGKEHQLLAQPMGKTSAVSLADPENNRKILASRRILNADKGTVPPEQAPVPMKAVDSSTNVKEYGYDGKTQTFYIRPKNGTLYAYKDVPIDVVKAMDQLPDTAEKGAMTKGKFFAKNIRNDYKLVGDEEE